MIRPFDVLLMALAVAAGVMLTLAGMRMARAHDGYENWKQPANGASCCDNRDCRPTRARMNDNEEWEAWDGERWIGIPPYTILKFPSPDGRSHLCITPYGTVLCFLPAPPKS